MALVLQPSPVQILSKLFDSYLHMHSVFLSRMDGLKDLLAIQKSVFSTEKQKKEILKVGDYNGKMNEELKKIIGVKDQECNK